MQPSNLQVHHMARSELYMGIKDIIYNNIKTIKNYCYFLINVV
jgi:hypothetical protein